MNLYKYTEKILKEMLLNINGLDNYRQIIDRILNIKNKSDDDSKVINIIINEIKISEKYPSEERLIRILNIKENMVHRENSYEYVNALLMLYEDIYEKLSKTDEIVDYAYKVRNNIAEEVDNEKIISLITSINNGNGIAIDDDIIDNLESHYENQKDISKVSTCIDEISKLGASFRKGTINSVLGYTGSYKTMYCINTAYKAIQDGYNVAYISLEIGRKDVYLNFISRHSNENKFNITISHSNIKNNELQESEKRYLFDTIIPDFKESIKKKLMVIDEDSFNKNTEIHFTKVLNEVDESFIRNTGKGIDVLFIDHLNLLKFESEENTMNDYARINHWMSYFRKNSGNFLKKNKEVCIVIAVQSNRQGFIDAKKNDGSYSLAAIAEGNEIERGSENVIAIYTDSELKKNNNAKVQLIKSRNNAVMLNPTIITVIPEYYLFHSRNIDEKIRKRVNIVDLNSLEVSSNE